MHVFGGSVCTRVCRFGVSVHVYMVRVCAGLEGVCVHGTCVCRFGGSVCTRYVCVQVWRECVYTVRVCVGLEGVCAWYVCLQVWRECVYTYVCVCRFGGSVYTRTCVCAGLEGVCVSRFGESMYIYMCVQGQDRVHVHACVHTWFGRSVYIHDCAGLTFVCSVHVDLFN